MVMVVMVVKRMGVEGMGMEMGIMLRICWDRLCRSQLEVEVVGGVLLEES